MKEKGQKTIRDNGHPVSARASTICRAALVNTICCFATNGVLLGLPGCFVSCYGCGYRRSLRTKYNLQEAPCGDFVTHFFYHLCAICQEYREIREHCSSSYPPDMKRLSLMPPWLKPWNQLSKLENDIFGWKVEKNLFGVV